MNFIKPLNPDFDLHVKWTNCIPVLSILMLESMIMVSSVKIAHFQSSCLSMTVRGCNSIIDGTVLLLLILFPSSPNFVEAKEDTDGRSAERDAGNHDKEQWNSTGSHGSTDEDSGDHQHWEGLTELLVEFHIFEELAFALVDLVIVNSARRISKRHWKYGSTMMDQFWEQDCKLNSY